ncbi:hypothetical protein COCCADRAFT_106222 [Bipolaris zeicola 26-R-13]|uniref:Peptidase S28 n=1 Tax=Cochliobolus carbonum (strain 26-R-13) TaxID=930089 RepID=W6Y375_COCC2|nr:uncharacterized protein COCCADRAFT_106222 [Bipolaris zeicola 26-R-13]EUC29559.1 hypothetical protein COCCADRAFT_106222 [Bipolaris zeicola 26-R-13]
MRVQLLALLTSSLAALACARTPASAPVKDRLGKRQWAYDAHTIDQPIDHFPHSDRYVPHTNKTFKQRYFFDKSYYKPGGPVFLYLGGETWGEWQLENLQTGIIQILMKKFNGLGVVLENRYYGYSFPYNTTTTDELRFLTTEQTIADNEYFRQHVKFPGVDADLSSPDTPWVMYGGSLAGSQVAFTMKMYNDIFAGGIGSSATITVQLEYPNWYKPLMKFGPSDCISRIISIIDKMDALIESGNTAAIQQLKDIFGLGSLSSLQDFASTIAFPLGGPISYPTNTWQELNWFPRDGSDDFWHFCSNITNPNPPASQLATDTALSAHSNGEPWTGLGNYAAYIKTVVLPLCTTGRINSTDDGCFSTQNATFYADPTNTNTRSYLYSTCTEIASYQTAPRTGPSLISRVLDISYNQAWCNQSFPPGSHSRIPALPEIQYNNVYGSSNMRVKNLAFIDGAADVWLDQCYHSTLLDGVRISSDDYPSYLIVDGGHMWDGQGIGDVEKEPQFMREAHLWEMRTVGRFLERWRGKKSG